MNITEQIRRYRWDLGITFASEGHRYDNPNWRFHLIKAPQNKWYADPFILDVTDNEIIVLVEEFTYDINRGRLAKIVIDRNKYRIVSEKIILDLPTHLSFPAILREGNIIYIYPENSASGNSILYRYNPTDDSLIRENTLCDLPLTDAIIKELNGHNYLFSTKIPTQNSNQLMVYESTELLGLYKPFQEIQLKDNTARSAGDIFIDGNKMIRPAQNCNGGYGVGLVFQEILRNNEGQIVLKELFRKSPYMNYIGMHTYNQYKGCVIVDLHTRRHPQLYKILFTIKRFYNRLVYCLNDLEITSHHNAQKLIWALVPQNQK